MPQNRPRPTFLYIGMPKAGSTWLFEALRQHPEVFVPIAKDIQYFDRHYDRGLDWYLDFFRPARHRRAIGELSHDYYAVPEAAARIARDLPGVKLICCLREPGDFVLSAYRYNKMHHLTDEVGFDDFIDLERTRRYTNYLENLRAYFDEFPPSDMKIVFYEDLANAPRALLSEIYGFLGVAGSFTPTVLHRRVNHARSPRSMAVTRFAYATGGLLRSLGMASLVGAVKSSPLVERSLYRREAVPDGGRPQAIARVRERCRRDYDALEGLIGKRLPQAWYGAR